MSQNKNNLIYLTNKFDLDDDIIFEPSVKYHRRNLPHWQKDSAIYFVTFRLSNTIPLTIIHQIRDEFKQQLAFESGKPNQKNYARIAQIKFQYFMKLDEYLDNHIHVQHLSNPQIAKIVHEAILFFAVVYVNDINKSKPNSGLKIINYAIEASGSKEIRFIIYRWCLMPNHVHLLMRPVLDRTTMKFYDLGKILHSIKSYSATQANKALKEKGQFWHHESYDHIVRSQNEFNKIWEYVDFNPLRSGLTLSIEDWTWSSEYFLKQLNT